MTATLTPDVEAAIHRTTAHHEAAHAVAAMMRGGSTLSSVAIDWDRPGHGLTRYRSKPVDGPFISYAGTWAEVRLEDEDNPIPRLEEEDNPTPWVCMDTVDCLLDLQPADLQGVGEFINFLTDREVWHQELERAWPVITAVAERLLERQEVTGAFILTALEATR